MSEIQAKTQTIGAAVKRRRGRPPGAKGLYGKSAKENVWAVFNRLGGTAAMAAWAKKHPTEFYRLYAKLVPAGVELDAKVDGNVSVEIVRFSDADKAP